MTRTEPQTFLSIPFERFSLNIDDLRSDIVRAIARKDTMVVLTLNLHALWIMQHDKQSANIHKAADRLVFDGVAVILLGRLSGLREIEKISSDMMMKALYAISEKTGCTLYLLGGPEGIAERAVENIRGNYPNVHIVGTRHGYFSASEEDDILREINELAPDVLAVGLSMPYEEKWIHKNRHKLKVSVVTNCGAYIEQTATAGIDYYPEWVYKYYLNWFYRILKEPKKLWKRYLFEGIWFLFWAPRYLMRKGKEPWLS